MDVAVTGVTFVGDVVLVLSGAVFMVAFILESVDGIIWIPTA